MTHWTEAAISAALEGKFYLVTGEDKNEIEKRREEARQRAIAEAAAREWRVEQAQNTIVENGPFTAASIIAAVAVAHGLGANDITSRSRHRHITYARHHACALMRELTGLPLQAIASAVRIVDHSTAHYAVKKWARCGHVFAIEDRHARKLLGVQS